MMLEKEKQQNRGKQGWPDAGNVTGHGGDKKVHKDNQIRKLQRDLKLTEDRYQKICSENRELNALFTKQQKDKDKRRAREAALMEAKEKARIEEEERPAVRARYDKKRRDEIQYEEFLQFKRRRY